MSMFILSLGFEGPNRVGKGTQCALMQAWLAERGVPALIIRGDGSRTGSGDCPGNPPSRWWQEVNAWIHTSRASYEDWNWASYRLARELVVWRDRVLPKWVETSGKNLGVLLVDRSLLSRTMIPRAAGIQDVSRNLYPARPGNRGRSLSPELVCPDLIFNLTTSRDILLARLESHDPKYEFRKKLILGTFTWFEDAANYLPAELKARVVNVDASVEKEAVFDQILRVLRARFELFETSRFTTGLPLYKKCLIQ